MKYKGLFLSLLMAGMCGTAISAHAETTSLGLAAGIADYGYRDTDALVLPLPIINYENHGFFIHSLTAGYYLWQDSNDKLAVDIRYAPLSFDPDKSDDAQMNQLNKRHSTVMSGLSWEHYANWGVLYTSIAGDNLDNSDGWVAEAAWLYPIHSGRWDVVPSFGVTWSNADQNQYYYGVSHSESVRSGMAEYSADDSWNPYMELALRYQITPNWYTAALIRATHYGSGISNSPMLDNDMSLQGTLGLAYNF